MSHATRGLADLFWAIFLLPSYLIGAVWWRSEHGRWVFVNPMDYADASTDWLSYAISFVGWVLVASIVYFVHYAIQFF